MVPWADLTAGSGLAQPQLSAEGAHGPCPQQVHTAGLLAVLLQPVQVDSHGQAVEVSPAWEQPAERLCSGACQHRPGAAHWQQLCCSSQAERSSSRGKQAQAAN